MQLMSLFNMRKIKPLSLVIALPLLLCAALVACVDSNQLDEGHKDSIFTRLTSTIVYCLFRGECKLRDPYESGGGAPGWGAAIIKDKSRYEAVDTMTISYVDYELPEVHLLLLSNDEIAFKYSLRLPAIYHDKNNKWGGIEFSNGGNTGGSQIAWDRNWPLQKQYKIWWQRVVDADLYSKRGQYDQYTSKSAEPGTTWCEAVITLNKPLPKTPGHFIIHFYPDGHIEGDLSTIIEDPLWKDDPWNISKYKVLNNAEKPRFTFEERTKLTSLVDKPCIKQIPNPYYGLPKPIQMN